MSEGTYHHEACLLCGIQRSACKDAEVRITPIHLATLRSMAAVSPLLWLRASELLAGKGASGTLFRPFGSWRAAVRRWQARHRAKASRQ